MTISLSDDHERQRWRTFHANGKRQGAKEMQAAVIACIR